MAFLCVWVKFFEDNIRENMWISMDPTLKEKNVLNCEVATHHTLSVGVAPF